MTPHAAYVAADNRGCPAARWPHGRALLSTIEGVLHDVGEDRLANQLGALIADADPDRPDQPLGLTAEDLAQARTWWDHDAAHGDADPMFQRGVHAAVDLLAGFADGSRERHRGPAVAPCGCPTTLFDHTDGLRRPITLQARDLPLGEKLPGAIWCVEHGWVTLPLDDGDAGA